ncbi:fatty acid desaturase [Paraburkholderia rhizosphaerae]|uniref:Fatty acid desaturase n=1 Tax=Paraburkholderia rhizosphaerae TaxID=480658 RepID=A0A4R8LWL4_9BURK|nr:fatty acid desaturase [Paraburkholderia rhizosphaerae]TDY52218.1 fatty acid desaturase [Paraburkholderia rhizosphaerae]
MESFDSAHLQTTAPHRAPGAVYLDEAQRQQVCAERASWAWRTEWPTWLLISTVYAAWFGIATQASHIGLPIAIPLLSVASAWYISLQHELLHGHPTRYPAFNALLGFAPLAVWFPYRVYRRSHLAHHAAPSLTDPDADPESFFVSTGDWHRAPSVVRALWIARATFAGRVLVGPALTLASTAHDACRRIARKDRQDVPAWAAHGLALAALVIWLDRQCGIPAWLFLCGVGYPALSITLVRSFQEHRYHPDRTRRSVINHPSLAWRLLFLNNNLHAVHHDLPSVPWFALPVVYRRHAAAYNQRNAGYVVHGYLEWWRRFAFTPVRFVAHSGGVGWCGPDESAAAKTAHLPIGAATTPMQRNRVGTP